TVMARIPAARPPWRQLLQHVRSRACPPTAPPPLRVLARELLVTPRLQATPPLPTLKMPLMVPDPSPCPCRHRARLSPLGGLPSDRDGDIVAKRLVLVATFPSELAPARPGPGSLVPCETIGNQPRRTYTCRKPSSQQTRSTGPRVTRRSA